MFSPKNIARVVAASLLLLTGFQLSGYAQTNSRDLKKESAMWDQLSAVAPDRVEAFKQGTERMDAQDWKAAAQLFQMVVDAAPQFDPALRRLGVCLSATGDVQRSVSSLEQAVAINRSPDNVATLGQILAFPLDGKTAPLEAKSRALALLKEAVQKRGEPDAGDLILTVQLAQALDDKDQFRRATGQLVEHFPDLAATHMFNAVRAAIDERWIEAEDEIHRAEKLGLPHSAVQEFLDSGVHKQATARRYAWYAAYVVLAWIAGLALLFVCGKALSRSTLSSIERDAGSGAAVTSNELVFRKIYRKLIDLAGFYYYVSLPFVTLLLIAVAGSVLYAFLAIGRVPIQLILGLVLVTGGTIYKMIQSLFVKIKAEDPGRALTLEEAPELWTLTREVASDVGTRAVEEIRITPGTDVAVYEKGSRKDKQQDKAKRILILGVGVLNGLRTTSFRAVLAHEYGHFTHRDTAGGDVAFRVNNDMMKFAMAMAMAGQAVWWNVGFQFVRIYYFLFRRISYGASRLQEVLADRMAALKYGADAFEEGLTHVIRRSIEFPFVANREIVLAVDGGRALHNLYDLSIDNENTVEEEVQKALQRPTSEDDTHPSPADRFRLVHRVQSEMRQSDSGMVWDLFRNREALTSEMSGLIDSAIDRSAKRVSNSSVPSFREVDL
jgi:Tfp pilus assembly protein PilF/Zn-dependent protease with chaperone function